LIYIILNEFIENSLISTSQILKNSIHLKIIISFEIFDLIHGLLKLRDFTKIEAFRIISHLWLLWIIALPRSKFFGIYTLLISAHLAVKYAFLAAVAWKFNLANLLKNIRYNLFYFILPIEFLFGNLIVLEFLFKATYFEWDLIKH